MEPEIEIVANARVSPTTRPHTINGRTMVDGGVFDAGMRPVLSALCIRENHLWNFPTPPAGPLEALAGNHLYGGFFITHFGHFLTEGLGRLWALDAIDPPVDGILYHVRAPGRGLIDPMFDLLRIDVPARFVTTGLTVERLFVPTQLHQLNIRRKGHPRFFEWFRERVAHVPPGNTGKVFVSRAGLAGDMARFAGERALELSLERAGFAIVRPETLSLAEQVAIYKAADVLLFSEGSAIHLYAMSTTKQQRVGMLVRRSGEMMREHVAEATENRLVLFKTLVRSAYPARRRNRSINLIDLERLADLLAEEGFIDRRQWIPPAPDEVLSDYEAACKALTEKFGDLEVFEPAS